MVADRGHRKSRLESLRIRGLDYTVRVWGRSDAPPLLMLHGARDSSASFQFVVDHLKGDYCVTAPDWRGHGASARAESYWFHDFVVDLCALASELFSTRAVPMVGHSLGGNIAGIYGGLRPERVSHLVSLDGFGPLVDEVSVDPIALFDRLLEASSPAGSRAYPNVEAMAQRLREANPRLTAERAAWLAHHASRETENGGRQWLHVPGFRRTLPSLRSMAEWGAIWSRITAPVLWIESGDQRPNAPVRFPDEMARRAAMVPRLDRAVVRETGHNLHHDAPEKVAELIEAFISRAP